MIAKLVFFCSSGCGLVGRVAFCIGEGNSPTVAAVPYTTNVIREKTPNEGLNLPDDPSCDGIMERDPEGNSPDPEPLTGPMIKTQRQWAHETKRNMAYPLKLPQEHGSRNGHGGGQMEGEYVP